MKYPIVRRKRGKGFAYYIGDELLTDKGTLARIKALAVPPAWQDVEIAPSARAKVQATGRDKEGRKQALYSERYRAQQEAAKFERITSFAEHLPAIREQIDKDLATPGLPKEKVLACIVKLMDEAYFRVGNDVYAKTHQTYGITTLRSKHTDVTGDQVTFDFTGKSGQKHHKVITNRQIARIIRQLDNLPGYEIFKYTDEQGSTHNINSSDVNAYIKTYMGEEYTAKDFRTWGGTLLAAAALTLEKRANTDKERKKTITACVKSVAKRLGNTPAVARSSYIDPRIISAYQTSNVIEETKETIATMKPRRYLKPEEACLLEILRTQSSSN